MLLSSLASVTVGNISNAAGMNPAGHSHPNDTNSAQHHAAAAAASAASDTLGKRRSMNALPGQSVAATLATPSVIATSISASPLSATIPMHPGAAFARDR